MTKYKIKDKVVLFPKEWSKDEVVAWVNNQAIRVCPICNKIDVPYNHFNTCNPLSEAALKANRDMARV